MKMALLAAEITNPVGPKGFTSGKMFLSSLITAMVRISLVAGVLIFFFILIAGAIQWMTAGGDKAAVEAARGKIMNAVVGIVILFVVFVIVQFIGSFFGVEALQILRINIDALKLKP